MLVWKGYGFLLDYVAFAQLVPKDLVRSNHVYMLLLHIFVDVPNNNEFILVVCLHGLLHNDGNFWRVAIDPDLFDAFRDVFFVQVELNDSLPEHAIEMNAPDVVFIIEDHMLVVQCKVIGVTTVCMNVFVCCHFQFLVGGNHHELIFALQTQESVES